jgi:hypothetical protein
MQIVWTAAHSEFRISEVYFPDLSRYEYYEYEGQAPALNVGWLDIAHPFTSRAVPQGFVECLRALARKPTNQMRGFHVCEFCDFGSITPSVDEAKAKYQRWLEADALGSAEIRVVGQGGTVYAAPTLICHYVAVHGYQPPQEFIEAVMQTKA